MLGLVHMRLQSTADLEPPVRGDHGTRTGSLGTSVAGAHSGTGNGKPDRADEAKWREALGEPVPQTPAQVALAAEVRPHKADAAAVPRSDGAAAPGDRAPALPSRKVAAAAVDLTKGAAVANGVVSAKAESSHSTEFAIHTDAAPVSGRVSFAASAVSPAADTRPTPAAPWPAPMATEERADLAAPMDATGRASDRDPALAGGVADRRRTGGTAGGAPIPGPAGHSLRTLEVAPAEPADPAPQARGAEFGTEPGTRVQWQVAAAAPQPDAVQPNLSRVAETGNRTILHRSVRNSAAWSDIAAVPTLVPAAAASGDGEANAVAAVTSLPDTEATAAATRNPQPTDLGESLFRLRATAEAPASPALPEPVEPPAVSEARDPPAPVAVRHALPSVEDAPDADPTFTLAAVSAEKPLAPARADPGRPIGSMAKSLVPGSDPSAGPDPEPPASRADPSTRSTPSLAEPAVRLPLTPAPLIADPTGEAVGQGFQTMVSLSGGVVPVLPLDPGAGPVSPLGAKELAHQIVRALPGGTGQEVAVVLSPEELGTVRMVMQAKGENLVLHIHADRAETLDLMRRSSDQLVQDLRNSGFTQVSLDFSQSRRNPTPQPQAASMAQTYAPGQSAPALPDTPAPARRQAAGGLDLRL